MGAPNRQSPWQVARRQHNVITHAQLLELGYSRKAIKHRVAKARLHVTWRGVYAVGRRELTRHGWLMAAVLACGEGAALTDESAAELWEIRDPRDGVIHVAVRTRGTRRLPGIRIRRRPSLPPEDITTHHRIRTTTPVRTVIDMARTAAGRELEALINEADKLDLVSPTELLAAVEARPGLPGVGRLRRVLEHHTLVLTDSELERRFIPIAERAGLPGPQTQVVLRGFRVDFYWPEVPLVVETDGLRYHRTPAQQARDRLRDQTLTAAEITVLRFTHAQVRHEPSYVEGILAAVTSAGSWDLRRPRAGSGGRPSR